MICACGLPSVRVLRTTTRDDGLLARRRACPDGHRWTTYEMHETVAKHVGLSRVEQAGASFLRGVRLRQQAQVTRELVAHHTGMSSTELAAVAGVTEARVRQLRKAC